MPFRPLMYLSRSLNGLAHNNQPKETKILIIAA